MKTGSLLAMGVFVLVAIGHGLRLVLGLPVTVGATPVPMAVSIVGVIVPSTLAVLLWRERRNNP